MRFLYLRDPLFLASFMLYWSNRFVFKQCSGIRFFHNHFNDLICIPFFVPIVLFIARACRIRPHDHPPQVYEIYLSLIVWSIMFELWFPSLPFWSQWVVGDPLDVFWYCMGASIASLWWRFHYRSAL